MVASPRYRIVVFGEKSVVLVIVHRLCSFGNTISIYTVVYRVPFRPSPSAVIRAIEEGAFKMKPKETDAHSIPDQLLGYIIEQLFSSSEWEAYRNDSTSFENAFLFLQLVLEKISAEEFIEQQVDRNPYYKYMYESKK